MAFDLDTSAGVTQLLAAVRASDIAAGEKNDLRDLVLSYAVSHDPATKITLEKKVSEYLLTPLPTPIKAAPTPQYAFGTTRPVPTMRQPSVPVSVKAVVSNADNAAPKPDESEVDIASQRPGEAAESTVVTSPSETVSSDATEPAPEPAPTPTQPSNISPLDRIKQIKADVNARSGNPANLIDITNDVGREYMATLLAAMKAVNSGVATQPFMDRLETSYQAVLRSLDSSATETAVPEQMTEQLQTVTSQIPPVTTVPETTSPLPVTPVDTVTEAVLDSSPAAHAYTPDIVIAQAASHDEENTPAAPDNLPTATNHSPVAEVVMSTDANAAQAVPDIPKSTPVAETAADSNPVTLPTSQIAVSPDSPVQLESVRGQSTKIPVRGPDTVTEAIENPILPDPPTMRVPSVYDSLPQYTPVSSLAESEKKPHHPTELKDPASIESSSVEGDPLYTPEVDSGLHQLLLEWSIFKKSGLFGTGPKGNQHPLFLKIKDLKIPLLLAGRFEGATQEIKQSITDYMNGWRYEQGIIYEQGERFEHYLRRVIRHILDLQK